MGDICGILHTLPIRVLLDSRIVAVEIPKSTLADGCQQNDFITEN